MLERGCDGGRKRSIDRRVCRRTGVDKWGGECSTGLQRGELGEGGGHGPVEVVVVQPQLRQASQAPQPLGQRA